MPTFTPTCNMINNYTMTSILSLTLAPMFKYLKQLGKIFCVCFVSFHCFVWAWVQVGSGQFIIMKTIRN